MQSPKEADAFRSYEAQVDGAMVRQRSDSFADHFSQATMFWNSMADWEKEHIVQAFFTCSITKFNSRESMNRVDRRAKVRRRLRSTVGSTTSDAVSRKTWFSVPSITRTTVQP